MKAPGGIEAFVVAAIERLGGATERRAEGLYTILWEPEGTGEPETRRLAFDPEAIEDDPAAEMVTRASPILERLLERVTARGRVAEAFLPLAPGTLRGVQDRLVRAYQFEEAAWTPGDGRPWWVPAGVFLFRARYRADSVEEELWEVAVNLADGRLLRRLGEAIARYGLAPEPWEPWPTAAELPLGDLLAVARAELESRLGPSVRRRRLELEARVRRESRRAAAYYDEILGELAAQLEALPSGDPRRPPLEAKARAVRVEKEGRLAELAGKGRLDVELALLSVLRLSLPRLVVLGRLAGKRQAADLSLVWDPIEQTGEPIRCNLCGTFTYRISLVPSGTPACPACLARAAAARDKW